MKNFILKALIFLLPLLVFAFFKPSILFEGIKKERLLGQEIRDSIVKSKQFSGQKVLILGDSVGYQIFPNFLEFDGVVSLACNQSIGVIGQYFLLKNYLEAGNRPEVVAMVIRPMSLNNNLDQSVTYQYFLKSFYGWEYRKHFTETVKKQISHWPYLYLLHIPYVTQTNWSPEYVDDYVRDYNFVSPISYEYLVKIKELSNQYNFKILMLSAPIPKAEKVVTQNLSASEARETGMEKEIEALLKSVYFEDDSKFSDGMHLRDGASFRDRYLKYWEGNTK